MKVRIDKSVFENANDEMRQMELRFLLNIIIYKQRYELKVTDTEVLITNSYKKLPQADQEVIQQEIAYSIMESTCDAGCEVATVGDEEYDLKIFSPSEAIIYLLQPMSIILENGLNDSHLVKAIFHWFDPTGELTRHENEGWIRFENAGGCSNVRNFLTARIKAYKDKPKFLKCYVLLDGDRRYPTDTEPDKKYRKLKENLEVLGVGYHVLEKRCMENYMPDDAVNSFNSEETKAWIKAYHTLTAEQKDYFSLAEGFTKDITKEQKANTRERESRLTTKDANRRKVSYVRGYLPKPEQNFYASVTRGNFLHLERGLKVKDFKVRFPEKYDDRNVTYRTNMLNRTSHQRDPQELEHIADGIKKMI